MFPQMGLSVRPTDVPHTGSLECCPLLEFLHSSEFSLFTFPYLFILAGVTSLQICRISWAKFVLLTLTAEDCSNCRGRKCTSMPYPAELLSDLLAALVAPELSTAEVLSDEECQKALRTATIRPFWLLLMWSMPT